MKKILEKGVPVVLKDVTYGFYIHFFLVGKGDWQFQGHVIGRQGNWWWVLGVELWTWPWNKAAIITLEVFRFFEAVKGTSGLKQCQFVIDVLNTYVYVVPW